MLRRQHVLIGAWTVGGFCFGVLFVIAGWIVTDAIYGAPVAVHRRHPELWIVDLAPFVLAGASALIGVQHARVDQAHRSAASLVRTRTMELELANTRLRDLIRTKDEFIGTVSHELRSPVTAVVGFSEEILQRLDDTDDGELVELVGLVASQGRELADLVDDLLVASRSDISTLVITRETVDLCEVIAQCTESFRRTPGLGMSLTDDLCSAEAMADRVRVRQILRNLLSNAERYGGADVHTRAGMDGRWAVVEVSDDGPGIPEDELDVVFAPYGRGSESRQSGSIGLGLTVSRTLARLMGGDLSYHRVDGRTVFRLTLPAANLAVLPGAAG